MNLQIDGNDRGAVGSDDAARHLAGLSNSPRADVQLTEGERSLMLLKSDERAMLVIFREDGDPGLTSRAGDQPGDRLLEFKHANGQIDEFPAAWTVSFADAIHAAAFFCSHRGPAPFLDWVDEAGQQGSAADAPHGARS